MSTVSAYEFSALEGSAPHQAEDVLSAAWAEAEQVRAQARAEGFAAGRAEGLSASEHEVAAALAALAGAATALDGVRAAIVESLQVQAAELALAVAEHVLSGTIEVERERVVDVCRGALRRLADRQKVMVMVNPDDLDILSAQIEALTAELGGIERFEVQADRRVDRGGVNVHTAHGAIDATISTQLARAREIVIEALRSDDDA